MALSREQLHSTMSGFAGLAVTGSTQSQCAVTGATLQSFGNVLYTKESMAALGGDLVLTG
jgi:hypothetical protein